MITPMSYARALWVVEHGPRTEAQRQQAVKALRHMAREFVKDGNDNLARLVRSEATQLLKVSI